MKLAIADQSLGLVPLAAGQVTMESGAALVHPCALLDALITLFEALWSRATPLMISPAGVIAVEDGAVAAGEDALVSLLLAGYPDDAIARRLNASTRTVQRRVRLLMEGVGASNRLQLGWHLARRDGLEDPSLSTA